MNIFNDVTYKNAKFYYKILYIIGYTKITKSNKFIDLKLYILRSTLFFSKYKVFKVLKIFFTHLLNK
jgi:hypothetical protein